MELWIIGKVFPGHDDGKCDGIYLSEAEAVDQCQAGVGAEQALRDAQLGMKINFGCGRRVLPGFFNIDAVHNPRAPRAPELLYAADFLAGGAILNPVPLADGCADELHAYHLIEHVFAWEAPALVAEWLRLLKPGGLLALELPNIEHAARNLLAGKPEQMWLWPMCGDPSHKDPYMMHKHCYTPASIKVLLASCGLVDIRLLPPQTHGPKPNRDMRVEARKP